MERGLKTQYCFFLLLPCSVNLFWGEMGDTEAWANIYYTYTRTNTWARLDLGNLNFAVSHL